ncbi:MAG TPA: hypothetical protein VJ881_01945 [Halanaerobiales bacterium]|nr:hypothetical protein [Halanaerobiales bacterium]
MEKQKKNLFGGVLIVLGAIWLLESFNFINVDLTLIIISSILLVIYFFSGKRAESRNVGLLIGGSIVLMIGLHSILNELFTLGKMDGVLFFLLLGTAFWIVQILHYSQISNVSWPTYVGTSLYVFSAIIFFSEYLEKGFFKYIWSIALILIGIFIIFKDRIRR